MALITSGGGFSTRSPQPEAQQVSVEAYKIRHDAFQPDFKGVPDVSALGHAVPVYVDGSPILLSGTSVSAPLFAGMITLMNDYRVQHVPGNGTIKNFLQFLYTVANNNAAALKTDVRFGNNCAGQSGVVTNSYPQWELDCFPATTGWDPVSGLGTINFPVFQQASVITVVVPSATTPAPGSGGGGGGGGACGSLSQQTCLGLAIGLPLGFVALVVGAVIFVCCFIRPRTSAAHAAAITSAARNPPPAQHDQPPRVTTGTAARGGGRHAPPTARMDLAPYCPDEPTTGRQRAINPSEGPPASDDDEVVQQQPQRRPPPEGHDPRHEPTYTPTPTA